MTHDYARNKASADRMIGKYGMDAILRVPTTTGPAYDPTPGAPVDHPCKVVVLDFSAYDRAEGRVLASDKKVLLAKGDLPIDPTPAHKLVFGGAVYSIIGPNEGNGVKTVAPGGVVLLYELQCRA